MEPQNRQAHALRGAAFLELGELGPAPDGFGAARARMPWPTDAFNMGDRARALGTPTGNATWQKILARAFLPGGRTPRKPPP